MFAPVPQTGSAGLWLQHGSPGQDTPGKLVTGLRRLTHAEEFLNAVPATQAHELALKRNAFATRHEQVFVAEPCSLPGQAECLELFLDYLPKRYPELYTLRGAGDARTITVTTTGETHAVADYAARPLELCARIAQEDLVLMRSADAPSSDPIGDQHVMTAAAVVFSFAALPEKLGQPLRFLHAPVPGFERDVAKLLNRTFNAIDPKEPLWRNNWGLFDNGSLEPSYGTPELLAALEKPLAAHERWLKVEYETLRRLPRSNNILFSIKTFVEPLSYLATVPGAAATLATSLEGMSQGMRAYKGVAKPEQQVEMLVYLQLLAAQADGAVSAR